MTTARLLGAAAALTVSAGLHLAASGVVVPEPPVLDGGGEAAPARMGASFADMVAGAPGVVRPETVRPVEAEAALPASADAIPQAVRDAAAPPAPTEAPPRALRQRADAVAPVATPAARTAHRATRTEPAVPASAPTPADAVAAAGPPPDRSAAQAAVPVMATRAEVTDRVEATEESEAAPLVSRRPVLRPDRMPDPTPRVAEPQRPPPAATGNAAADATRGSDGGLPAAEATASAPVPTRTPQAGNTAEAANYPGQVLRRIARQGRPRVRHDGADAVVTFRIDAGGGLASLGLARSSGNPALDEAALSIVRSAAPFPRPPAGAQTAFSINFGGG